MQRAKVLGYPVDTISYEDALTQVFASQSFIHIVTINPEMIELAQTNKDFDSILKNADLVVPDGIGIKLALKLRNIEQEQIAGCEFAKSIIARTCDSGDKIAFIGAKEEVLKLAIEKLKDEMPNIDIAYSQNGYFSGNEEDQIIENIKNSGAKYLFVALGAPKQEFFIQKCREQGCNICAIGVGGSFDVWSGLTQRAPEIWQKMGLEWLYRTLKEPKRFKRIFPTLPLFLFKVIISRKRECKNSFE